MRKLYVLDMKQVQNKAFTRYTKLNTVIPQSLGSVGLCSNHQEVSLKAKFFPSLSYEDSLAPEKGDIQIFDPKRTWELQLFIQ